MLQLLQAKWRLVAEAIDGMDDPQGDYLLALENRVHRLEGELERLRKHLLMDALAPIQPADAATTR